MMKEMSLCRLCSNHKILACFDPRNTHRHKLSLRVEMASQCEIPKTVYWIFPEQIHSLCNSSCWLWSLIPVTFTSDGGPTDQPINDLGVNVLNMSMSLQPWKWHMATSDRWSVEEADKRRRKCVTADPQVWENYHDAVDIQSSDSYFLSQNFTCRRIEYFSGTLWPF